MEDKNNLDDLIGTSGQPIVVQSGSSDKKFLYIIIALLVLLFIIALGVIAFISGKYFANSNNNAAVAPTTQNVVAKQEATTPIKSRVEPQTSQSNKVQQNVSSKTQTQSQQKESKSASESNTISELEKLVQEQEKPSKQAFSSAQKTQQNAIAKAASAAAGGKSLSQEELAKIAQLVAKELAKAKANSSTKTTPATKDEELVASLQSAQTDTLKNQEVNTQNLVDTKVNSANAKKVDTFNKVIVKEKSGGDDDIAKLSAEIDSILQSDEVAKKEQSLKFGKELKQEIASREREMRFIVVKPGDTLSSLAYKAYGRASAYVKLYKANPDLVKNPNRIYVGMKLRVPVDEEYVKNQGN